MSEFHADTEEWRSRFHAGDRRALEECYREYFDTVEVSVRRFISGADRETVIHEVFLKLISSEKARQSFRGGSMSAWLRTIARNQAIDYLRRHKRVKNLDALEAQEIPSPEPDPADRVEAQLLIQTFRDRHLPSRWADVFEVRFIQRLSQREAAARIGCSRTTLAYREMRIRKLLRRFLLRGG